MNLDNKFILPFIEATIETLDSMCGLEIKQTGDIEYAGAELELDDLVCIIGCSSPKVKGRVILTSSWECASEFVSAMMGEEIPVDDPDFMDAFSEVQNIIAGCGAAKLPYDNVLITLPTTMVGKGQTMANGKASALALITFECASKNKLKMALTMEEI